MGTKVLISAAVEGIVDEAVVEKLIRRAGGEPGSVYGKAGKALLRKRIEGYNKAAYLSPWIVLVDLDQEEECPPPLLKEWLPTVAPRLCFRVAVRAVEAWLLADAGNLAGFLGIPKKRIPEDPESLESPKQFLVDLARRSKRRVIREDMVPREGSGRSAGPAYTSRMLQFVMDSWNPARAALHAPSLRRAVACLERLIRP